MNKQYAEDSNTTLILNIGSIFLILALKVWLTFAHFSRKTIISVTDEIIAYLESNVYANISEPDTV